MFEAEELMKDIDILRERLEYLIKEKKENLCDSDVISASKILNDALNQYNKFLDGKIIYKK